MGQQQSTEEKKGSGPRAGTPNDKDKDKINRRRSAHMPSSVRGRATPVQASATTESATAHTTNPQHLERPQLQQILQSPSPDPMSRTRSKRDKKDEPAHHRQLPVNVPSPSTPMNVPTPSSSRSKTDDLDDKSFDRHNYGDDPDDFDEQRYVPPADHRPPRLPLPIADAGPMPDSPNLDPIDKGANSDLEFFGNEDPLTGEEPTLRRKSSMMSTATQDDDDIGDELPPVDPEAETVPTTIEWLHEGHKVYVTGTFVTWEKKYRLHHKKDGTGLATTINLPPGTHHLMFLVDEKMMTNPSMPTAVDFNNFLVNYIEIATEDVHKTRRDSRQQSDEKRESIQVHPPQVLPEDDQSDRSSFHEDAEPVAEEILPGDFRQIIPQPLVDLDLSEEDPRWRRAFDIIQECQVPPQLPMFLSRSLLNGYTPVKDDSSVLTLPNHTVLNHLMTSSVKSGVLATSVTTRYKKKYVTTISFKPVPRPNATAA